MESVRRSQLPYSSPNMNKAGKVSKETVVLRQWESIASNSVLTTELKTKISLREELKG